MITILYNWKEIYESRTQIKETTREEEADCPILSRPKKNSESHRVRRKSWPKRNNQGKIDDQGLSS